MNFYPETVVWELTTACNANCIHCGSRSGVARKGELTEAEALALCDELKALGCKRITIIGGEMFLSPYWEKVTKRLVDNGIFVAPLTNGLLIDETTLDKLLAIGISNLAFSIDGLAEIHDYIRGIPGMFDEITENIKLAQKKGFTVGVNTSVSALNLDELPGIHQWMLDLNIKPWQIQLVEDMGNANENPELKMSPEGIYRLAKYIAEFRQQDNDMRIYTCHNIGWFCSFEPLIRNQPFTGCVAGRYVLGIESTGNLRGCLSIMGGDPAANVEGNIRERSLTDIWNDPNSFRHFRQREVKDLTGFCAGCKYNNLCRGGCSSIAYALVGKFTENPWCLYKYEVENGLVPEEATEA